MPRAHFGPKNWRYHAVGSKRTTKPGYIEVKIAEPDVWMYEHRHVMQTHLGRTLGPHEVVHHKNGKRDDNTLDNLEVKPRGKHTSDHHSYGTTTQSCRHCGTSFTRPFSWIKKRRAGKLLYCSVSCSSKHQGHGGPRPAQIQWAKKRASSSS